MSRIIIYIEKNEKSTLVFLTLLTFILRLVFTFFSYLKFGVTHTEYIYWGEQFAIGNWAEPSDLASRMIVGPFIPLLIAIFIKFFTDPVLPFYLYNVMLTSLAVPVLYFLAKDLFGAKTGWLLCVWGVFFPEFFRYSPFILKESTLFFIIPATLLMLERSIREPQKLRYAALTGLAFAVLMHTDERFVFYIPYFTAGFFLISPLKISAVIKPVLIWSGIIILLNIPWVIRNYKVYDQLVVISPRTTAITSYFWGEKVTHLNFSSYENARDRNKEKFSERSATFEKSYSDAPRSFTRAGVKVRAFINFWQPAYFKPQYITYGFRPQKWSLQHNIASILFYGMFLPFYLAGLVIFFRKKYALGLFIAMIPLIHSLLHMYLVSPLERYRSPISFIVVVIGFWNLNLIFEGVIKMLSTNDLK